MSAVGIIPYISRAFLTSSLPFIEHDKDFVPGAMVLPALSSGFVLLFLCADSEFLCR
jgi:hypothetical protein